MTEADPAIKLFGRAIQLPEILMEAVETVESELDYSIRSVDDELDDDDSLRKEESSPSDHLSDKNNLNGDETEEESANTDSLAVTTMTTTYVNTEDDVINHNSLESVIIDEVTTFSSKDEVEDEENGGKSQDKTLKKPEKILPCPRCNSMDTKFCYYNNYNVNQPRHYCKRCQRYWTAGGIMRNVPIGSGRRKNKYIGVASHCRHINLSHLPNGTHSNQAVLAFGYDNGWLQDFPNTGKTLTKPRKSDTSKEGQSDDLMQYSHSVPPQPWPYPWNLNPSVSAVSLNPSGYQLPFYPLTPFWGFSSVPSVWNAQNFSTLGKHSRDDNNVSNTGKEEGINLGKCIWIPKPLRMDDLGEASRSSLWKTLGIKMEKNDFVSEKSGFLNTSSVLQANPAAFSRSLNFREST